ncbi:hypothetical protein SDC9_126576 [bioreactor metagenome]|uniref:Uncharacterized protein n=1 Tax=bioreactor metagenome TaxID=1076179 RepID=A0A645CRM6_9ZZZZ
MQRRVIERLRIDRLPAQGKGERLVPAEGRVEAADSMRNIGIMAVHILLRQAIACIGQRRAARPAYHSPQPVRTFGLQVMVEIIDLFIAETLQ